MIYELDITANIHDADYNGVIRASALMRYIQTAAQNQLTENGMSYEELRDKYKKAFLLSRIRLDFSEPIRAYDRITALTYPCESKAYSFLRCYAIKRTAKLSDGLSLCGRSLTPKRTGLSRRGASTSDLRCTSRTSLRWKGFICPLSFLVSGSTR